ncbi:MAG: histidinol-phosphate transaminase [Paracoccaceae bacterium]
MIDPQPGILSIAPYQGGAAALPGVAAPLKLSSNENPLGPPPSALRAAADALPDLHRYPSTDHARLRAAIAELHGLDAARILCGAGSDEVIHLLCQAYAGPGTTVLHTAHGFAMYRICALAAGATPVEVPEAERTVDIDALIAAATPETRLVFIANPANPTGTMLDDAALTRLADGLPDTCLLVLDGAYAEYADGYDGGAALVDARENVVMTRTFSKLYGLGGMRVGWGYGPAPVIDALDRIRGPFNLSSVALAAAEAAVRDHAFADTARRTNAAQRDRLIAGLRDLGLACDDSHANFALARFGAAPAADAAEAALRASGILVRKVAGYGFPDGLRITVGTEGDVTRVLSTLSAHLSAAA